MVANCSGQRVGAMTPPSRLCDLQKWENRKKNILDRKTKMVANRSVQFVGADDTCVSPVRPSEIEISQKKVFTEKRKWSQTVQGNI